MQKPPNKKYLLAIDPGLMTGLSFLDITDPDNPEVMWTLEAEVEDFYNAIDEVISHYAENLVVVIENFIITVETAKKAQAPWSLRGYGAVQFLCMKHGVKLNHYSPSEAKNFSTNEKLKKAEFWHVGGAGHANDSLRHAMLYLSKKNPKWTRKLLV